MGDKRPEQFEHRRFVAGFLQQLPARRLFGRFTGVQMPGGSSSVMERTALRYWRTSKSLPFAVTATTTTKFAPWMA